MSTADNLELLQRETSVPGLALVLDPLRVQELLRSQAAIRSEDRVELVYIRYKPGRRALSLMQVVEPSGRQRPLVVNACDPAGWDKLISVQRDEDQPSLLMPKLKSSLDWFPCDRRLRSAAKLFEPTKTAKVLKRVVGEPTPNPWALSMLAYKPHRRLVLKATSGSTALALKCYTGADYTHTCKQVQRVGEARIDGCSPCLVGTSDHYAIIASAWIDGEVLSSDLSDAATWQRQFPKVGQLLAGLHVEGSRSLTTITHQHTAFAQASLTQLIADIVWLMPELKQPLSQLLNRIEKAIAVFAAGSDLIHGDFYTKQIIVQGENLHLIDFDEVGRGHCYQDLGNFVGKLYWNAVRDSKDTKQFRPAVEAFLGGYERAKETIDWPLFQASVVAAILRSLPHAFRRGLPNWRDKMHQMFELALAWCPTHHRSFAQFMSPATNGQRFDAAPSDSETAFYLDIDRINGQLRQQANPAGSVAGAQAVGAKVLRYKPGKRLLVEYSLQDSDGSITQVIGKARLRKSVDKRVIQLHHDLQILRSSGVRIPLVLGTLPKINMWLQEKLRGEPVRPGSSTAVHRTVGQALAALHGCGITIDRSYSVQDELTVLREQFEKWLFPKEEFATEGQVLLGECEQWASSLAPMDTVFIHRDFYFDQVLSLGNRVALLDFDLATMGPPELDVGNYLAHLDEYGIRNQCQLDCQRASQAFLEGYVRNCTGIEVANVDIWRRLSMARLVAISQRIPERSHVTSALLNRRCVSPNVCVL